MLDASALLTHLSLSLSLCSQFLSAENGASTDFLAGLRRAFGCGFCLAPTLLGRSMGKQAKDVASEVCTAHERARTQRCVAQRMSQRVLVERRCFCPSPVVALEEAPVRVPTRAGAVRPGRRGPIGPGSRRSPSTTATCAAGRSRRTNRDLHNRITTKETR